MMFSGIIFGTLAAGAAINGAQAGLSARTQLPEGYTLVPMKWTGAAVPSGPNVTLEGTIEEVKAQIDEARAAAGVAPVLAGTTPSDPDSPLVKRARNSYCNMGLDDPAHLEQGISYLRGVEGDCGLDGGSHICGRISCSYNSAIYWCNDNEHYSSWRCSDFADVADDIVTICKIVDNNSGIADWTAWGEAIDDQGFTVKVGGDRC
ncbi:hypothetical protein F5Y15DRAFT_380790 [Xylariaceae sp. FL0016]|nr:hypothetical protein F5Y15DRAFT_380790 [Xylariaceae sp. FL0016]